ncbi:hypothetical protein R1sor_026670 [Riccia sorocarpa]|uniref:Uncharacterized protein n=1 Tax=Riccia sorocarpa TaxID=122646 RepID=A0ABD3GDR1_9MARC
MGNGDGLTWVEDFGRPDFSSARLPSSHEFQLALFPIQPYDGQRAVDALRNIARLTAGVPPEIFARLGLNDFFALDFAPPNIPAVIEFVENYDGVRHRSIVGGREVELSLENICNALRLPVGTTMCPRLKQKQHLADWYSKEVRGVLIWYVKTKVDPDGNPENEDLDWASIVRKTWESEIGFLQQHFWTDKYEGKARTCLGQTLTHFLIQMGIIVAGEPVPVQPGVANVVPEEEDPSDLIFEGDTEDLEEGDSASIGGWNTSDFETLDGGLARRTLENTVSTGRAQADEAGPSSPYRGLRADARPLVVERRGHEPATGYTGANSPRTTLWMETIRNIYAARPEATEELEPTEGGTELSKEEDDEDDGDEATTPIMSPDVPVMAIDRDPGNRVVSPRQGSPGAGSLESGDREAAEVLTQLSEEPVRTEKRKCRLRRLGSSSELDVEVPKRAKLPDHPVLMDTNLSNEPRPSVGNDDVHALALEPEASKRNNRTETITETTGTREDTGKKRVDEGADENLDPVVNTTGAQAGQHHTSSSPRRAHEAGSSGTRTPEAGPSEITNPCSSHRYQTLSGCARYALEPDASRRTETGTDRCKKPVYEGADENLDIWVDLGAQAGQHHTSSSPRRTHEAGSPGNRTPEAGPFVAPGRCRARSGGTEKMTKGDEKSVGSKTHDTVTLTPNNMSVRTASLTPDDESVRTVSLTPEPLFVTPGKVKPTPVAVGASNTSTITPTGEASSLSREPVETRLTPLQKEIGKGLEVLIRYRKFGNIPPMKVPETHFSHRINLANYDIEGKSDEQIRITVAELLTEVEHEVRQAGSVYFRILMKAFAGSADVVPHWSQACEWVMNKYVDLQKRCKNLTNTEEHLVRDLEALQPAVDALDYLRGRHKELQAVVNRLTEDVKKLQRQKVALAVGVRAAVSWEGDRTVDSWDSLTQYWGAPLSEDLNFMFSSLPRRQHTQLLNEYYAKLAESIRQTKLDVKAALETQKEITRKEHEEALKQTELQETEGTSASRRALIPQPKDLVNILDKTELLLAAVRDEEMEEMGGQ